MIDLKKFKLPDSPGVYFFLGRPKPIAEGGKKGNPPSHKATAGRRTILYIGKATSLRDRTKSYFSKDLIATRGPAILDMVVQADKVEYQETDSVLEALILEAELIKKHQPKYNVKEKDDKSWNYVCITREEIPRVLIIRGKELQSAKQNFLSCALPRVRVGTLGRNNFALRFSAKFGPYTNGLQLREAMKIIRRIFPYIDGESIKKNNVEFYKQLGLTPDGLKEHRENIKNLKLFFQGKKKKIIQSLKKEMITYAKKREFERAGEIKKRIFSLEHINDIALIKKAKEFSFAFSNFRIEAYDVAHMSGKNMVGVMTVIENEEVAKNEYKKFIIRSQSGANDTGALEEILSRRFRHTEWGLPSLVVVDGSIAQINVATRVLKRYQLKIPVVGVVKDDRHKAKAIQGDEAIIKKCKSQILLANSEAHRFAIKFYRSKSRKNMLK